MLGWFDEAQDPCHYKGETLETKVSKAAKAENKGKATPSESSGNQLSRIAAKVLMKLMYCARYGRFDLLRAIGRLASYITKWDALCDKKLLRLIQYVKFSKGIRQMGFIGDKKEDLTVNLFTDADFAGTNADMKSTSGVFLVITGPNSFFPYCGPVQETGVCLQVHPRSRAYSYGLRTAANRAPRPDFVGSYFGTHYGESRRKKGTDPRSGSYCIGCLSRQYCDQHHCAFWQSPNTQARTSYARSRNRVGPRGCNRP